MGANLPRFDHPVPTQTGFLHCPRRNKNGIKPVGLDSHKLNTPLLTPFFARRRERELGEEAQVDFGTGGRKNYYGSGSLWRVTLAAAMFSILATLKHWNVNPHFVGLWKRPSLAFLPMERVIDLARFVGPQRSSDETLPGEERTSRSRANPTGQ